MKKTLKIPAELRRDAGIAEVKEDGAIRLSISSDEPYLRYDWMADEDYYEVLDHSPQGVNVSRIQNGTALLFNHDRDMQLGTINAPSLENGRCYVMAKMSDASDVAGYIQRVREGILKDTSIGYQLTDEGECIGAKDGIPIYKFKFAINEASLVTIPADMSVGMGRQRSTKDAAGEEIRMQEIAVEVKNGVDSTWKETNTNPTRQNLMPPIESPEVIETPKIDVVAERKAAINEHKAECKKIDDYVKALKNPQWKEAALKIGEKHKDLDTPNFKEFQADAVQHFDGVIRLEQEQANPNVGLSPKDIRCFSMVKAIHELAGPKRALTGHEKAVCEFAAKQYENKDGRTFEGVCIPSDITDARVDETFDLNARGMENLAWEMRQIGRQLNRTMNASTFASGGFLVGTDLLAGSFIEYLRNACFIGQGPFSIIELGGLVGNVAIPKQTTTATTYWLPEGGAVTASEFAGSQLYGTPHRLACLSQWTKQLMLQSTPAVEMLVRNDQARAVAVEEDRVVYQGSGASGEPIGIINTTGVDASVTFSGNWTQAKSLAFQLAIENANANTIGEMVFVTNPTSKSYAMGTVQVSSSTFPIYIWMGSMGEYPTIAGSKGGRVLDYGAYSTKNMTARVLFGIYNNNVTKFRWGGFDLMVEPYTGAANEIVKSYLNEWIDVGLRYPQAFSYSTDAPTSP